MRWSVLVAVLIAAALAGVAGFAVLAWRPEIAPIDPPGAETFDPSLVEAGRRLADIGNCNICHTRDGGRPFAGGRPLSAPFGTIYSTNITPEPDGGIGRWSEAAFIRALHEGTDRRGRHLYPAFPYHHFTKLTDDDAKALYAFVMTREPIAAKIPPNELWFPFNFRPAIAGWKLLFLERGVFQPDPTRSPEWNRGAYLVEGLGHCGACHTPFNLFGGDRKGAHLAGGESEGWQAPALNHQSPAPTPWTADQLFNYLHTGWDDTHGAPAGPMAPVAQNLARVPAADVRAIAAYIATQGIAKPDEPDEPKVPERGGRDAPEQRFDDLLVRQGRELFAGACAMCHGDAKQPGGKPVDLTASTPVNASEPSNVIHIVMDGVHRDDVSMPGFATVFSDRQIAAVTSYVRMRFSNGPRWQNIENDVRRLRSIAETSAQRMFGGDPRRAPESLTRYGCAACHQATARRGPDGRVGPPLDAVKDRVYLAGTLANTPENFVRWVVDPHRFKPGTAMPKTGIGEDDARDIAAYLYRN